MSNVCIVFYSLLFSCVFSAFLIRLWIQNSNRIDRYLFVQPKIFYEYIFSLSRASLHLFFFLSFAFLFNRRNFSAFVFRFDRFLSLFHFHFHVRGAILSIFFSPFRFRTFFLLVVRLPRFFYPKHFCFDKITQKFLFFDVRNRKSRSNI